MERIYNITQHLILTYSCSFLYFIFNYLLLLYLPSLYLYLSRSTGYQQSGSKGWDLFAILKNSGQFYIRIVDQSVDHSQLIINR